MILENPFPDQREGFSIGTDLALVFNNERESEKMKIE
jgi:hypothetical protein